MNKVKVEMSCGLQLFQVIMGLMKAQASIEDLTLEIQVAGPFVTLCEVKTEKVPLVLFDDQKDYSTVDIAVQINSSYEVHSLWKEFKELGLEYKQDMGGNLITIGKLNGFEVAIAPVINEVGGVRILYVEATSDVVCWSMIEEWIKAKVGKEIDIVSNPANLIGSYNSFIYDRDQKEMKK